jgi:hypothetical protein
VAALTLGPERPLIFRITHIDNVRWILQHGLCCRNSAVCDPNYRQIGNADVIGKRQGRVVPIPPGGTLSDYVPFYFTPWSPMLLNIITGRGVPHVAKADLVIIVSSLPLLSEQGRAFVFTDRHAYLSTAQYYSNLQDLTHVDWNLLNSKRFRKDPDDPGRFERYQAEALVHYCVPLGALLGIACYDPGAGERLRKAITAAGVAIRVSVHKDWYF